MRTSCYAILGFLICSAFPQGAAAALINFDDQGLTGPSIFAIAGPAQHLTFDDFEGGVIDVAFDGGVVLTEVTLLEANESSVYGTAYFGDVSLLNPLTVTFSQPITNFFLDIYNGLGTQIEYRVADNDGHSASFVLDPYFEGGHRQIGFAATGTVITITSVTPPTSEFDFFIDNIYFNEVLPVGLDGHVDEHLGETPVPEPSTMAMLLLGAGGLTVYRRSRKHSIC